MPATLDRDMLSRMGVLTCRGPPDIIAGRKEGHPGGQESQLGCQLLPHSPQHACE